MGTSLHVEVVRRLRQQLRSGLTLVLTAVVLTVLPACEREAPPARPATGAAQSASRRTRLPAPAQSAPLTERAWWNQQELIDGLGLTAEQRAKMDTLLTNAIETQRAAQQQQREQQKALKDALEAGNWEAARHAANAAADGITTNWRTQTALKIDILAMLDANQQQLVASQYRQLLRQTSVLGRLRGEARRRPATPGTPGAQ
jgi:Spy/CpxP family protein refolding chaperone